MSCSLAVLAAILVVSARAQSRNEIQQAWSHLQQAEQYFRTGTLERAKQEASLALRLLPQMVEAETLLGVIEDASGRPAEAEINFTRALKVRPDFGPARFNLAMVYLKQHKVEMAKRELETVVRLDPSHAGAHYYLGLTLRSVQRPGEAILHFKKAHQIEPNNLETLLGLLNCQLDLKQQAEVAKTFQDVTRLLNARDPRLLEFGSLLANRGAYALAIKAFQKIVHANPDSYNANYNLAFAFFLSNDLSSAEGVLDRLLRRHNAAEAHNLLARVHEKTSRYLQAVAEYELAAALDPGNEDFRFDYCLMLVQHRALDLGIDRLTQATRDFPKSGRIWVVLGTADYLRDDYEKAIQSLFHATEVAPHLSQSYYYLGKVYGKVGTALRTDIMERLKGYLMLEPQDPWAHYFYGVGLFETQREQSARNFSEVEGHFKEAIRLKSDFAEAYFRLGLVYSEQGKIRESIVEFQQAAAADLDMSEPHYRLAIAFAKLGEKDKAERESLLLKKLRAEASDEKDKRRSEFFDVIRNAK